MNTALFRICFGLCLTIAGLPGALAQPPEVHADRTVTFRIMLPGAKEVKLAFEGQKLPMAKDAQGAWSLTTDPLEPDFYSYRFVADGTPLTDPSAPHIKTNLLDVPEMVHVPGAAGLPWELADVPHGTLHRHFLASAVAGDKRDLYVYTPPNYDPTQTTRYPVLYLLHGFGDDASSWTSVGQAHVILDNLIARGKAKPMIVVMPYGYGAPEILQRVNGRPRFAEFRQQNLDKFRETVLTEVMPLVEKNYRVSTRREDRAISGVSMGGAESLYTGLNNLDKFAWIGSFSSGGLSSDFARDFASLSAKDNSRIKLLWVACGTDDNLIRANRQFLGWLQSAQVKATPIETGGGHSWRLWRRNLVEFAPLLFR